MRMSDMIEEFIKELFEEDNDYIEIQRNDLAEHFNCVPSQINYVISTRFKPSQGYYVESRRGGGGHITSAGAQLTDCTLTEAANKIKELLYKMKEEGDIE